MRLLRFLPALAIGLCCDFAQAQPNAAAPTTPGPSPTDSSPTNTWNGSTSPDTDFACMTADHHKGMKTANGQCKPMLNSKETNAYPPSNIKGGKATPSSQQPQ